MLNPDIPIVTILPQNQQINANSGETLLETLLENSIMVRSDCGGKGVCKKCMVELVGTSSKPTTTPACTYSVDSEITIRIPESSRAVIHCVTKSHTDFPKSFLQRVKAKNTDHIKPGIAIDLGTTTIALYLCDLSSRTVLSSLAIKNPQSLYGDDVMSRICTISQTKTKLTALQKLVTGSIEFGCRELLLNSSLEPNSLEDIAIVGNPTMIHILLGISPSTIGTSPYMPSFHESRFTNAGDVGIRLTQTTITTLPQMSGFLGGDILSAAIAVDLENMPNGTLLIDLGTNGELLLKSANGYFGTSCATGPAFEGATLSCGMQASPGAIDKIWVDNHPTTTKYSFIKHDEKPLDPTGICGSGIISGIAALTKAGIIEKNGSFTRSLPTPNLKDGNGNGRRYVLFHGKDNQSLGEVAISQKDVRSVQLGKAALITGIEFMMKAAGIDTPRQILIAGTFGSHIGVGDLLTLGMIPQIAVENIHTVGNSAGTGAIMTLCDQGYVSDAENLVEKINVIELATDSAFQKAFIDNLQF